MNLNALNTGLTQAPLPTATEGLPSMAGSQRAPAGTLSGEDFAAFLRNQINALKHQERQEMAAPPLPPAAAPRPERLTPYRPVREAQARDEREPHQPVRADQAKDKSNASQTRSEDAGSTQAAPEVQGEQPVDKKQVGTQDDVRSLTSADQPMATAEATVTAKTDTEPTVAEPGLAADAAPVPGTELTTIPLSSNINIITTAQSQPDEQSVADFALAMGLDPSQVKALFGEAALTKTTVQNPSTQQVLAMNSLPSFDAGLLNPAATAALTSQPLAAPNTEAPVATADFQALLSTTDAPSGDAMPLNALQNLNIQLATGPMNPAPANAMPISTLAVLSMMDTELRAEDIDALKTEFDALSATDAGVSGLGERGLNSPASHAPAAGKAAAALANQPNMAQTYDQLSEKLATELASRMNDQLNAGEWKMKFALKPASLGLVDVQLEMRDGRLTAQFNADTALTQDLIQNGSQRLKEALGQLGMNNASVLVGQGQTQQQGQSGQSGSPARHDDNRVKLADDNAPELTTSTKPRHSNSLQFDNYA
ncbi:MAG: hypothetical protein RI998_1260 [Pseudomonadota bacterium]